MTEEKPHCYGEKMIDFKKEMRVIIFHGGVGN